MIDFPRPRILGEQDIHKQYGKRAFLRTYEMPGGRKEPFFNFGAPVVPCLAVPITKSGNVVIVRQFRFGDDEFVFEVPGGCPKSGQTPEEAVRAELDEEIGYRCGEIKQLHEPRPFEPASCSTRFMSFLVTGCVFEHPPHLEPNEILEVIEWPVDKLLAEINDGLYIDPKSIFALHYALPHLGYKIVRG